MDTNRSDFEKWFHSFREEMGFRQLFVSDEYFAPLICGIAQVEAFENTYINSVFSSFASLKAALEKVGLIDPLNFSLYANEDYSKVIIFFFDDVGDLDKIKVYPNLKDTSFYAYEHIKENEEECIKFIEECLFL